MTAQPEKDIIFLASICLEPNRWKKDPEKQPSLSVSEWSAAAANAGFDGWELWEPHYFRAGDGEPENLARSSLPVRIFNSYLIAGSDPDSDWERVVRAIRVLGPQVRSIKFNLGKAGKPWEEQADAALRWAEKLPPEVRMLCECHPGTVIEEPQAAAAAFARWPEDRFGAIVHPFADDPAHIRRWFDALGDRIEHLHWQSRDADQRVCALDAKGEVFNVVVEALHEAGFRGTQSVEFVEGTGQPGESVEGLFAAAVRDLKTLRSHGWAGKLSPRGSAE